jgi:hypothetical protein
MIDALPNEICPECKEEVIPGEPAHVDEEHGDVFHPKCFIKRLWENLKRRDEFIVERGLWDEFTRWLKQLP